MPINKGMIMKKQTIKIEIITDADEYQIVNIPKKHPNQEKLEVDDGIMNYEQAVAALAVNVYNLSKSSASTFATHATLESMRSIVELIDEYAYQLNDIDN